MGLAKASRKAAALAPFAKSSGYSAIAVAGLGGALGDDFSPGDVVRRRPSREYGRQGGRPALVGAVACRELCRCGITATTGTVVSTDHIVTGPERAALARSGAVVVDMESTAIAEAGWELPLAVVRAISDSPGEELFSPAGARGVLRGLRSLPRRRAPGPGAVGGRRGSPRAPSRRTPVVLRRCRAGHRDGRARSSISTARPCTCGARSSTTPVSSPDSRRPAPCSWRNWRRCRTGRGRFLCSRVATSVQAEARNRGRCPPSTPPARW